MMPAAAAIFGLKSGHSAAALADEASQIETFQIFLDNFFEILRIP
jgi:hypothetical protein